jgi:hypothetical protein
MLQHISFIPGTVALGGPEQIAKNKLWHLLNHLRIIEYARRNINDRDSSTRRLWVNFMCKLCRMRNLIWNIVLFGFMFVMFYMLPYYMLKTAIVGRKKLKFLRRLLVSLVYLLYLLTTNKVLYYFKDKESSFFAFYLQTTQIMEYLGIFVFW